jgi:c-di-GMP phosphodiesterase
VRPTDVGFELPADMTFEMVKIDRDVLGMDPDERSRKISALTSMGHEMGAVVVVEGTENAALMWQRGRSYPAQSTLDAVRQR